MNFCWNFGRFWKKLMITLLITPTKIEYMPLILKLFVEIILLIFYQKLVQIPSLNNLQNRQIGFASRLIRYWLSTSYLQESSSNTLTWELDPITEMKALEQHFVHFGNPSTRTKLMSPIKSYLIFSFDVNTNGNSFGLPFLLHFFSWMAAR